MTKTLLLTALGASVLLLAGCKKKPDVNVSNGDTVTVTPANAGETVSGFTKEEYMKTCKASMTEKTCNCFVDFYNDIGLKVTELGDSAKIQAKTENLSAEQMAKMSACFE